MNTCLHFSMPASQTFLRWLSDADIRIKNYFKMDVGKKFLQFGDSFNSAAVVGFLKFGIIAEN
jgi:hypothetical protein